MLLRRSLPFLVALGLAACGGGGGSGPTSPSNNSGNNTTGNIVTSCGGGTAKGTMTATIDGAAWTAICISAAAWPNNILSLGASDGKQSIGLGAFAAGPGSYSMTNGAANALVNLIPASASTWTANATGGTGTLTLTQLNTTGAAGTFTFTAVAVPGTGATSSKVVTSGSFNITF